MSAKNNTLKRRSVQIIIDNGRGWVLQHRDNKDGIFWPNRYSLWGGSFESVDENKPIKAALRELYEETGFIKEELKLTKLGKVVYDNKVFINGPENSIEVHYYYAKIVLQKNVYAREGDGAQQFDYETKFENNEKFAPYVAEAVNLSKNLKL